MRNRQRDAGRTSTTLRSPAAEKERSCSGGCGGERRNRSIPTPRLALRRVRFVVRQASASFHPRSPRVAQNRAYQFEESGRDAQEDAGQVKPSGVQPAVETRAGEPSHDEGCGEDECQLAVAGCLNPEVLFLFFFLYATGLFASEILDF